MKKIYSLLTALLMAALLLPACKREQVAPVQTPAIDVTNNKLDPNTNESGTVRAYVGTEVTAVGFNLDKVGGVKIGGKDAEIVRKDIRTLVFKIPALDLPQADEPAKVRLEVFEQGTDTRVFQYDYFVTIPVTDALISGFTPKSGTVGTEVTLSGRNLTQVTQVSFAGVNGDIQACLDESVTVLVPAVPGSEANSEIAITATWGGGTIDVTAAEKFQLKRPAFTAFTQQDDVHLGDEIVLSGENLDLVDGVKWGDVDLLISEQSATSLTIKVPSSIEKMDPVVQSKELAASFGTPAQKVVIAAALRIDTTPVGPASPVFTSAAPADNNYTAFYLGKEVVVKGENFASIEKFKVDGIEAELTAAATDIEAHFIMPKTITGTAEKDVTLVAIWNGGNELDCGTIKVRPFQYTKGLRLGKGCGSKLYTDFDAANAFLILDEGVVVSTDVWSNRPIDPACTSSGNSLVVSGNKIAPEKEAEYYACTPYTYLSVTSNTNLQFNNPSNSSSQLKTHRLSDLATALPSQFGTPVVFMGVLKDGEIKTACANGTLTDIGSNTEIAAKSSPRYPNQDWAKGDVILLQYLKYKHVSTTGGKASLLTDVYQTGYLYIRDITITTAADNNYIESGGYVEVDLYWSNVLN